MSTNQIPNYTAIQGTNDADQILPLWIDGNNHLEVAIHAPRTPFGALNVESMTPEFQADAVYGINPREVVATTGHAVTPGAANSGANVGTNNLFKSSTGTTIYSFATMQSRKRIRYRAGQGVVGRFTALWSAPAALSTVVAGYGTSESGFFFGYNGTTFGILHSTGNVREVQTLTITTASTATNDYNIQLSGVTTNVTATNNASTIKTAYEISKGTYPGWKASQRGSTVVFLADSPGNKAGTFSVAQAGAGTPIAGTFAETTAGSTTADTWIAQTAWNGDKLDGSGASGVTLDKTKGNVFQIDIQYLGFGGVVFKVEVCPNGNNPDFVTVHTIAAPNSRTSVTVNQPSFPFTMAAYSGGSTTDVSVSVGSFAGFLEGKKIITGPRMTPFIETNNFVGSTAATYYPLFTIRNEYVHSHNGGVTAKANQSIVYPLSISCSHDDATPLTFYLIRNATLLGTPNFTQFDNESCMYWDTAATTCTIAERSDVQFAYTLGQGSGGAFAFTDELSIQPGETYTIAARAVTGTATYVIASINTKEDQ